MEIISLIVALIGGLFVMALPIAFFALVGFGIYAALKKSRSKLNKPQTITQKQQTVKSPEGKDNQEETTTPEKTLGYAGHYQAKYLLTKNEYFEWRKLHKYASARGLLICPKVRLLDIIEPRRGDPNYMSYMGKIKSKHVDFVICDKDLRIKGVLELDDSSHDQKGRQERDQFVDEILTSVGYKVIHTRSITENTLDAITAPQTEEAKAEETA